MRILRFSRFSPWCIADTQTRLARSDIGRCTGVSPTRSLAVLKTNCWEPFFAQCSIEALEALVRNKRRKLTPTTRICRKQRPVDAQIQTRPPRHCGNLHSRVAISRHLSALPLSSQTASEHLLPLLSPTTSESEVITTSSWVITAEIPTGTTPVGSQQLPLHRPPYLSSGDIRLSGGNRPRGLARHNPNFSTFKHSY